MTILSEKERQEDDMFDAIKADTKFASAVVGLYDTAYQDGKNHGIKYSNEMASYNETLGWVAVVCAAFLTGIFIGVSL